MSCRICMSSEDEEDLCCPCDCKGSNKWVHGKCQIRWVLSSKRYSCEICGYQWLETPRETKTIQARAYIDGSQMLDDILIGFSLMCHALIFYTKHIIIQIVK